MDSVMLGHIVAPEPQVVDPWIKPTAVTLSKLSEQ